MRITPSKGHYCLYEARGDAECGQGWYQETLPQSVCDTLAPQALDSPSDTPSEGPSEAPPKPLPDPLAKPLEDPLTKPPARGPGDPLA